MEDLWQEDAKRNTRLSKSGKPVNIEKGYEKRGVGSKEAERRAWATVNKLDRGDRKKVEEVAEKSEVNQVPTKWKKRWSKVEPPKAQAIELGTKRLRNVIRSLGNGQVNFILIWPVSLVQPWLPFYREPCASFSEDALRAKLYFSGDAFVCALLSSWQPSGNVPSVASPLASRVPTTLALTRSDVSRA
jgi:hypothetical protein